MPTVTLTPLPIDEVLPLIRDAVVRAGAVVLEAPPGAGKTTRVPPMLLDLPGGERGDVLVLEPRRIAARMAARRVAEERGEKLGETVGYAVRFEEVRGPRTRLMFVTEGVLTRRLLGDPTLRGVAAVVLDEFHERHVHTDVALALLARLRKSARRDLKLVVMSATLDAAPVARFLGAPGIPSSSPNSRLRLEPAALIRAEGRRFEVRITHEDAPDDRALELRVASAVRRAMTEESAGHVLVFLPGAGEIRQAMEACAPIADKHGALVLPLHGDMPADEQDRAVLPSARRKIILSTNVAESSLTIEGVACVVDSGLLRRAQHSPYSGLPSLRVEKASRASCVQRSGRAGRTREGRAYRLYPRADFESRPEQETPELLRADLAATLLELRSAGVRDLEWLDPPPPKALAAAEDLLGRLGAITAPPSDAGGAITETGRAMLRLPVHPRLARIVVEAERRGVLDDGLLVAALLGERDIRLAARVRPGERVRQADLPTERSDVLAMVDAFRDVERSKFSPGAARAAGLDLGVLRRVELALKQLRRSTRSDPDQSGHHDALLVAILAGYVDRVAKRLSGRSLAVAGGGKAELAETSVVRDTPLMVAIDAEQRGTGVLVRIASAIEPEQLVELAADRIAEESVVEWNASAERAERIARVRYDGLAIEETRSKASGPEASELLFAAARERGAASFSRDEELEALRQRARFAHSVDPGVPELDDAALERILRECCEGRASFAELRESNLLDWVRASLGAGAAAIDRLAPSRITLPSGRSAKIHYEAGKDPFVASRLQDFFGLKETPRIGGGRVALVLHLLAPNQRAVQVTSDLGGFWTRHYPGIRKELMRKYPRHAWPEVV